MFHGGLWRFVMVCGVLWWFVVFSATQFLVPITFDTMEL